MPTLCRAYTTETEANAAVDRLLRAGVLDADVRVLRGETTQDSRDVPVRSFAGAEPEAVGAYAGAPHAAREGMGTFAGDADGQRRGGFADIDRETVTTHRNGMRAVRVASHHRLKAMLIGAGLDEAAAESDVEALHRGRVLVLVRGDVDVRELAAALDG
jgi:hypothetical protein